MDVVQDFLPEILRVPDVQRYLGLSRPTAYLLVNRPGFPTVRIGSAIRIPRDMFLAWLDEQAGGGKDDGNKPSWQLLSRTNSWDGYVM